MSNMVALLDPHSSGAHLVGEFALHGWSAVAVLSSPPPREVYGPLKHRGQFLDVIVGLTSATTWSLSPWTATPTQTGCRSCRHPVPLNGGCRWSP